MLSRTLVLKVKHKALATSDGSESPKPKFYQVCLCNKNILSAVYLKAETQLVTDGKNIIVNVEPPDPCTLLKGLDTYVTLALYSTILIKSSVINVIF